MSSSGAYPPDFSTDTGRIRLLIGDLNATNISGATADYGFFSDADIQGYLSLESNVYRAAAFAVNALATQAADQAAVTKDYDLSYDARQRAEQFREQARQLFERAVLVDAEGDEGFQIVSTGRRYTRAELAELDLSQFDLTEFIV